MKLMGFLILIMVCFFLAACPTKKPDSELQPDAIEKPRAVVEKKVRFSKELRESLYFAASLEREALRLISRQNSYEPTTLFSVLSYAFEIEAGTKKSAPLGIDCGRFRIDSEIESFSLFKTCQKPATLLAVIHPNSNNTHYKVEFKVKDWAGVIGISVALTNSDIVCQFQIKNKKLSSFDCEHWAFLLSTSDASATEIRLSTFEFKRDQSQQLKLQGGFFRDLVERKKIVVSVPLQGKIKLIEKELEVKDDFVELPKTNEAPNGKKEENSKKSSEKSSEKEDYEKWIKGESQAQGQNQSQDVSPGQVEGQNQSESPVENQDSQKVESHEIEQDQNNGGVPKAGSGRRGR